MKKIVKLPRRVSLFLSDDVDEEVRVIAAKTRRSISKTANALLRLGLRAYQGAQQGEQS